MDESTETVNLGFIESEPPRAAEYVDGYVFFISNDNGLYVASDEDLSDARRLSTLTCGDLSLANFIDMAYSKADGQLYGLFYADDNRKATPYLCTIDMFLGTTTLVGEMSVDAVNLAIDGKGNFYSTLYNGEYAVHLYGPDLPDPVCGGGPPAAMPARLSTAWPGTTIQISCTGATPPTT